MSDRDWNDDGQGDWNEHEGRDEESFALPAFIRDPWGAVLRRRVWIIASLILGLIVTCVVAYSQIPFYQSRSTLLMTGQQISEDFIRPTVSEDGARTNAMIGEILSRASLAEVIEQNNLYPELQGKMPMSAIVAQMRANIFIYPESGGGGGGKRGRTPSSRIYVVAHQSEDPKVAALVANELAAQFVQTSIKMRTQQARMTTEFLQRELEEAERELRTQDRKITEFHQHYRGELPGELGSNIGKLERAHTQSASMLLQIEDLEARIRGLNEGRGPSIQENQLHILREKLAEELSIRTDEHPNVATLQARIERLEQEIQQAGPNSFGISPGRTAMIESDKLALARLRGAYAKNEQAIVDATGRVDRTPMRKEELDALHEEEGVLRGTYLEYLRKVQEAELAQDLESAQQGARVSVLDRAEPNYTPVQSRMMTFLAGAGLALGFALAVAVLIELIDPVIVSREQLEAIAERPVLGSIPRVA